MAIYRRVFPYVAGTQTFTMPYGYDKKVTYHVWGGGGGAGGDSNDIQAGNGTAGTYTTGQFYANPGDQITVVTGQGGQEGIRLNSNRKIMSMNLPGAQSPGGSWTGAWGWVNDPTKAVYPQYSGWLTPRTFPSRWNQFMNLYAVSDIPSGQSGTEDITNHIYFPEAGSYTVLAAGDNVMTVYWNDQVLMTCNNNFNSGQISKTISVPTPGVYDLRYVLVNAAGSGSGNPAGAAITITRSPPSYMGSNYVYRDLIWCTRFGTNVDVTNRVSLYHAPMVPFYQPQRGGYDWSGFDGKAMAFISASSTWTDDELSKLNLSRDMVQTISYPVRIKAWGGVDQYISSGYYTFKRGQTWQLAAYSWAGNQEGTYADNAPKYIAANNPGYNISPRASHGSGTPSNWTEKQFVNDNKGARTYWTEANPCVNWELPVPADDTIYIVGFDDGEYFDNYIPPGYGPDRRYYSGTDNLQWLVTSSFGQQYAGGNGGASAKNVGATRTNYFGGWGGQIGSGKTSGGGGGGGGASLLLWKPASSSRPAIVTVAGGGAGGGGAGYTSQGSDGIGETRAGSSYPNTVGAGLYGGSGSDSGGGGGGGGGGLQGGQGGGAANQGNPPGRGGSGGYLGSSSATLTDVDLPTVDFVMIGRGGDGGRGGGGGGAGELLVGRTPLKRSQFIQVGGAGGGERLEGAPSAIWWDDATWVAAGPGGRGGQPDAAYGRNGNGQNGGCINGDTGTPRYGGSGGGGGTNPQLAGASGGGSKGLPTKPSFVTISGDFQNGGGSCGSGAGGGGGGSGGGGNGGGGDHRGGNGGAGRTVTLGQSGKTYRLGGGGGGAPPNNYRNGLYIGMGQDGGGDGDSGAGPTAEFRDVNTYTMYVPRNTTTLYAQGIGGGGGGGSYATRGSGGGGAGGYLPQTSYTVAPGQRIDVTVGRGGSPGQDGSDTIIKFYAFGDIAENIVTLRGGKTGLNDPSNEPAGGAGGAPNGAAGQNGNQSGPFAPYSGRGADSPYGRGGDNCQCDDTRSRPGSGSGAGSGGGGGGPSRAGGLGANGYVRFNWDGGQNVNAAANTGSGGGGGFDSGGGNGGSGFVAIGYPGEPIFKYYVDGREIAPIVQNGWTVHECYASGYLNYGTVIPEGSIQQTGGVDPAGTGVTGYIPGTASGGFGHDQPSAYPISAVREYPEFLNTYGVWGENSFDSSYVRTYTLAVPVTTTYVMKCAADNGATVKINDKVFFDLNPPTRDNSQYWWRNVQEQRRTIEAGIYTLSINAQNISGTGAFALTIAYDSRQNDFIFNSRTPPVTGGSATGGNGLVILEMQGNESTAKIKQNDYWKKLLTTHVKVGGEWKLVPEAWVKVDGQWLPLYGGGAPITPTINTGSDVYGQGSKP